MTFAEQLGEYTVYIIEGVAVTFILALIAEYFFKKWKAKKRAKNPTLTNKEIVRAET